MGADQLLPPPQCRDPFVHHLYDEAAPTCDQSAASSAPPIDHSPSPALLERLSVDQHSSVLQAWNCLPSHMREIAFYFHGPDWTPAVITKLGEVLSEFSDVLSKS